MGKKTEVKKHQIGVLGCSSDAEISPKVKKLAEEIGQEIAKTHSILICGGLDGIMKFVAKGAKKNGGLVIGIVPLLDKKIANKFIDVVICSGMEYYLRGNIVAHSSDAIIALPGETGTLAEICTAIGYEKPIILLKENDALAGLPIRRLFDKRKKSNLLYANGAKDAVSKAINYLKGKNARNNNQ